MIGFYKAIKMIAGHAEPLGRDFLPLEEATGHILAEDVRARFPLPRFDSSAVDGYAVRLRDTKKLPAVLKVNGEIRAGGGAARTPGAGGTVRIYTGAPLPGWADAVVMQEDVKISGSSIVLREAPAARQHIRFAGEEFRKGEIVLRESQPLTPPVLGLLASLGYTTVKVRRKPKAALIVTGNELRKAPAGLKGGEIYDSNSYGLEAAIRIGGYSLVSCRIVRDEPSSILKAVKSGMRRADVLITAGGVSVGRYDHVKEAFGKLGVRQVFWQVAIRPGKPTYFGKKGKKLLFGLPGNPVSALLSYRLFVLPALRLMEGDPWKLQTFRARLTDPLRKKSGRLEFVRGKLSPGPEGRQAVTPLKARDSHMLGALALADCLIHLPEKACSLRKGSQVMVSRLRWRE